MATQPSPKLSLLKATADAATASPRARTVSFGVASVASAMALLAISTVVDGLYYAGQSAAPLQQVQIAESAPPAPAAASAPAPAAPAAPVETAAVPVAAAAAPEVDLKKHPGRTVYLKKGACAACHGRDGAKAISYYPAVAGQDKKYIIQQLNDIIAGKRRGGIDEATGHPRAEAMRGALVTSEGAIRIDANDIEQMADWLTQSEPARPQAPETPISAESTAAGQKLFAKCIACHGKEGKKPLKGYPFIAGQKRIYVVQQLTDIRGGARNNGLVKVMLPFVKNLSDAEIGALADYLSQIDRTAN